MRLTNDAGEKKAKILSASLIRVCSSNINWKSMIVCVYVGTVHCLIGNITIQNITPHTFNTKNITLLFYGSRYQILKHRFQKHILYFEQWFPIFFASWKPWTYHLNSKYPYIKDDANNLETISPQSTFLGKRQYNTFGHSDSQN